MRNIYSTCMNTSSIEEHSLTEVKELVAEVGGWPVVEGEDWEGEEGFLWHELSIRAAQEGFDTSRIISIGQSLVNIDSKALQ